MTLATTCFVFASARGVETSATTKPSNGRGPTLPVDAELPIVHPLPPARPIATLKDAPLYTFSETDVDAYLKYLRTTEPDPIQRLLHLARKNIGQPYEIYLLGEYPYELYDPDPMYCL